MIRETAFRISRRPYAVDMASLRIEEREGYKGRAYYAGTVRAVWFRRRHGITMACTGILWDTQDNCPADAAAFLTAHTDGRYGGDCKGRWDGTRYWGAQEPDVIERHLDLLRPMLEHFPEVPPGFDGWWRF